MNRFWSKVNKTETCWLWMGALVRGYGQTFINGKRMYAHRYLYELVYGAIQNNLQVDHLCRIRACVNPDHLDAVTQRENLSRSRISTEWTIGKYQKEKQHCKQGHPFNKENTYSYRGYRRCRTCHANDQRLRYSLKKIKNEQNKKQIL